jgi:hypothetical protein
MSLRVISTDAIMPPASDDTGHRFTKMAGWESLASQELRRLV